jgi:long-subunit fatty acid transport protein
MYKKIVFILLFLSFVIDAGAQNTVSSPYSKYGIGDNVGFTNTINASMGGIYNALRRNNFVNHRNPASYTAIDTQSFVFDIGYYSNNIILQSNSAVSKGNTGGISHILFAFPLSKTLKMAGGILPVSVIDFSAAESFPKDSIIGSHKFIYDGEGGINKVMLGIAYQPSFFDKLSIGVNAEYLFGNYYRSSTLTFPDSANTLSSRTEYNYSISAFNFNFGAQYLQTFNNGDALTIGFNYVLPAHLPTKNQYRHYTFSSAAAIETIRDSIKYSNTTGEIQLPQSVGVGLSYARENKFLFGLDLGYEQWSNFSLQGVTYEQILKDNYTFNIGCEYKPNIYGNYLEKIAYRLGVNYQTGIITLRNTNISQIGIALGFGLPIKKQGTQVNLYLEYCKKGTTQNDLIREDYLRVGISFSARDRWFFKRKYQ